MSPSGGGVASRSARRHASGMRPPLWSVGSMRWICSTASPSPRAATTCSPSRVTSIPKWIRPSAVRSSERWVGRRSGAVRADGRCRWPRRRRRTTRAARRSRRARARDRGPAAAGWRPRRRRRSRGPRWRWRRRRGSSGGAVRVASSSARRWARSMWRDGSAEAQGTVTEDLLIGWPPSGRLRIQAITRGIASPLPSWLVRGVGGKGRPAARSPGPARAAWSPGPCTRGCPGAGRATTAARTIPR